MARTVAIGNQDFEGIIANHCFYIDKTNFIKEWWESMDAVTLITRPRRFGKTLNMDMVNKFFSVEYAGREDLFAELSIWKDEKYRELQGTYPVLSLSFANINGNTYQSVQNKIRILICQLFRKYTPFFQADDSMDETDKKLSLELSSNMDCDTLAVSLNLLSELLMKHYGKKVIILLDEYDTPVQEAYVNGYWDEITSFIRSLFNSTFKTNPYLERAILTGITRVSKESIFSGLNNLVVVTTTTNQYTDSFGFTQEEVSDALAEYGLTEQEDEVKYWYDGFTFGERTDIYNPWSIINFLRYKQFDTYWANTSSNSLVNQLVREGNNEIKQKMEDLLSGGTIRTEVDEQIIFQQIGHSDTAIWGLLLASGYLKVEKFRFDAGRRKKEYELKLTNEEVQIMFEHMIRDWFTKRNIYYNDFIKALLAGDVSAMNLYMNHITQDIFSYFDTGTKPSKTAKPECFYHGFVLGLIVELFDRYFITSNRESGYGRYDVMLKPKNKTDDAIIIEFKVRDAKKEDTLEDTVKTALEQIEEMHYEANMNVEGIPSARIRKYGFAFEGKDVLIG